MCSVLHVFALAQFLTSENRVCLETENVRGSLGQVNGKDKDGKLVWGSVWGLDLPSISILVRGHAYYGCGMSRTASALEKRYNGSDSIIPLLSYAASGRLSSRVRVTSRVGPFSAT